MIIDRPCDITLIKVPVRPNYLFLGYVKIVINGNYVLSFFLGKRGGYYGGVNIFLEKKTLS